ncbi:MAG TPA: hypothetical protein VLT36_07140 [Candidatus Dormibacteraeota bacterium]|nr:hypothetical protein [Candidatus Dormibacteraeota bacterium]
MSTNLPPTPVSRTEREPSPARSTSAIANAEAKVLSWLRERRPCEPGTARGPLQTVSNLWRAKFLAPKDLVRRAIVIAVLYLLASLAGLREFTSLLSNTAGSVELGFRMSAFLGIGYVVLHLAFVLLVPILLLSALLLRCLSFSSRAS